MSTDRALPRQITRPLFGGAIALGLFLVGLVIWSFTAPLTTSIQVSGSLASSRPSFDIQHQFGGPIATVHVAEQQRVARGDLLLMLDVSSQQNALDEIEIQLRVLTDETNAIKALISQPDTPLNATTNEAAHYAARQRRTQLRQQELLVEASALLDQVSASQAEQALLDERIALQTDLRTKQLHLLDQGLTREADVDGLTDQILELSADLQQQKTQQISLNSQAARAQTQADSLIAEFEAELLSKLQENTMRLSQLRTDKDRLAQEIAAAAITAPVSGHIHALKFPSAQMYAPRGQSLAVIAQNLNAPVARLTVAPGDIDQVSVGMTGKLAISSLPQREMPPLEIVITALSPRPKRMPRA